LVDIRQQAFQRFKAFQGVSFATVKGVSYRRFKKPPLGGFETHGTHRPKTVKRFMVEKAP
jgi:hypothetical protein